MLLISFCAKPGGLYELESDTWIIPAGTRDVRGIDYHAGTHRVYFCSSNHGSPDVGFVDLTTGKIIVKTFEGQDWHGLFVSGMNVFAIGPLQPSLLSAFDLELLSRKTIPLNCDRRINDIYPVVDGSIVFCDHGGGIFRTGDPPRLLFNSPSETHSVVWDNGQIFWAESAQHRVKCDGLVIWEDPYESYVRGIAVTEDYIYIGTGRDRHNDNGASRLVVLDRVTLNQVDERNFGMKEIYGIRYIAHSALRAGYSCA